MDDDLADALAKANRVSIRAILLPDGEDAAQALAENGIDNPVVVPFIYANETFDSGGVMGDGRTPNVVATLERDQNDRSNAESGSSPPATHQPVGAAGLEVPTTMTLPAAFGIKPLAPVWKRPLATKSS